VFCPAEKATLVGSRLLPERSPLVDSSYTTATAAFAAGVNVKQVKSARGKRLAILISYK
jgi:hypothetical protein